jgi:hypothetical protein
VKPDSADTIQGDKQLNPGVLERIVDYLTDLRVKNNICLIDKLIEWSWNKPSHNMRSSTQSHLK